MSKPEITPDFYIVGAPKCGTTAFDSYLNLHPEITMLPKEIHYWGKDLVYREENPKLESYYFNQLNKAKQNKIGEGAVWYLASKTAANELKTFSPNAKILIFLRNPTEAIYSLYYNTYYNGDDLSESFEKALENQEKRKTVLPEFYNCPTIAFQYQHIYAYYEQVKRYIDVFGKENTKIIFFEEFITNKQKIYNEVLHFLNLEYYNIDFKQINANKEIRSSSVRSFLFTPKKRVKQIVKTLIPIKSWREKIKLQLLEANSKYTKRPEMNEQTKEMLNNYFSSDIKKLEQLLDKDLSFWNK